MNYIYVNFDELQGRAFVKACKTPLAILFCFARKIDIASYSQHMVATVHNINAL